MELIRLSLVLVSVWALCLVSGLNIARTHQAPAAPAPAPEAAAAVPNIAAIPRTVQERKTLPPSTAAVSPDAEIPLNLKMSPS